MLAAVPTGAAAKHPQEHHSGEAEVIDISF